MRFPRYCFLLGAGASRSIGIPTMPEMGKQFFDHFDLPGFKDVLHELDRIPEVLASSWGTYRNIEELLRQLYRHVSTGGPKTRDKGRDLMTRSCAVIAHEARKYILSAVSIHDDLEPILPLTQFFKGQSVVDVFSLNYDTVIEEICGRSRLPWVDGCSKSGEWAPGVFKEAKSGVRLWKMHGSITWAPGPHGLPKRTLAPFSVSRWLLSGHMATATAETAVIWPAADKTTAMEGGFKTLLDSFAEILPQYEVVIAVGYRFADEHIVDRLFSALNANKSLRVIVICGKDGKEICERIKAADSSYSHRVDCLPGKFEEVLASGALSRMLSNQSSSGFGTIALPRGLGDLNTPVEPVVLPKNDLPEAAHNDVCIRKGRVSAFRVIGTRLYLSTEGRPWSSLTWRIVSTGREYRFRRIRGAVSDFAALKNQELLLLDSKLGGFSLGMGVLWRGSSEGDLSLFSRIPLSQIASSCFWAALHRDGVVKCFKALASGFLSWPTGVDVNDDGSKIIVSEARRFGELNLDGSLISQTERRFFNLLSVRYAGAKLLLLENVLGKEGVVWSAINCTDHPEPLVTGIRNASGLAISKEKEAAFFCECLPFPEGKIWKYCLRTNDVTAIRSGLDMPRKLDVSEGGDLIYSTDGGLFQFLP